MEAIAFHVLALEMNVHSFRWSHNEVYRHSEQGLLQHLSSCFLMRLARTPKVKSVNDHGQFRFRSPVLIKRLTSFNAMMVAINTKMQNNDTARQGRK